MLVPQTPGAGELEVEPALVLVEYSGIRGEVESRAFRRKKVASHEVLPERQ